MDYVPTTEQVRGHYAWKSQSIAAVPGYLVAGEDFDRWLADHDRQVAEKAWDEGFSAGFYDPLAGGFSDASESKATNPYTEAPNDDQPHE